MEIRLRDFSADDAPAIVALFRDTVRNINRADYTHAQVRAWAPEVIYEDKWAEKLSRNYTVVAECNGVICGFGDLDHTGYFDHLFVHKDFQRCGVASAIEAAIADRAKQQGSEIITVAASITAKPFFLRKRYTLIREQEVEFNGQIFTNYFMAKQVPA